MVSEMKAGLLGLLGCHGLARVSFFLSCQKKKARGATAKTVFGHGNAIGIGEREALMFPIFNIS
jgi:hypothetical protein